MNGLVDAWGFWGFDAAWQAAAVAAVILAVVWLGRRWPAPIRYGLLLVALAKFALPPIVSLPMSPFSHWGPEVARVEQKIATPVVYEPQPIAAEMPSVTIEMSDLETFPPEPASIPLELADTSQASYPLPSALQGTSWNWKPILLIVHLTGMAVVAGWLAIQWLRLRQLQRSACETLDERIRGRFAFLSKQLGVRRSVRLLIGSNDTVPCSFGLLRPVVIVPETLVSELSEDLDRVLAHELAHHRRGDLWVNAVQLGLFVVWWFNPLYWLLHRSLRTVREDCCDDLLLATGIASPGDYCDTILRVASNQKSTGPLAIASSMADYPHPLEKRFRRIMDGSLRRSVRLGWRGLAAVIVLAAVLLPGARGSAELETDARTKAAVEQAVISQPMETDSLKTPRMGEARRVVGRVVDESGQCIEGARVWLPLQKQKGTHTIGARSEDWLTAEANTDEQGRFVLKISGDWISSPRLNQYCHTIYVYKPGKQIGAGNAFEALFREDPKEVEIVLGPETDTRIVVTKPDGTAATDVAVIPNHNPMWGLLPDELARLVSARTDARGETTLRALSLEHMVMVAVEAEGFGRQIHHKDDSLTEAGIWKVPLAPVGRVVGRVEGDPEAVTGLRVGLQTANALAEVDTDEFGRFEVADLAVGPLSVSARLPREAKLRLRIPTSLVVSEGQTTEVVLRSEPGVLVEGRIVASDSGRPIADADIQIISQGQLTPGGIIVMGTNSQQEQVVSDENGRFSARVLPGTVGCLALGIPGPYQQSLESRRIAVQIPAGTERVELPTIHAIRQVTVSGRVIDHEGRPVSNARLNVLGAEGQSVWSRVARTDESGSYQGLEIPADSDREKLQYMIEEFRPQPVRTSIVQLAPFVLQLPAPLNQETGTILEGRIVDQYGDPVEGASVNLLGRRTGGYVHYGWASPICQLKTDSEGRFRTTDWLRCDYEYEVGMVRGSQETLVTEGCAALKATGPVTSLGNIQVRTKVPDPVELLQGVERVRTNFPRPILIEIEAQFEEKRLRNVHRNRVIFDGNRYRFRGINDDRINPCSIFDGTTAMHYDGTSSCTIRPPSNWTADYLFDPKTLGLTTLLQPGRDVAACLAYRDAKQVILIGKETMGTEGRTVGDTWHVRVVDKHDQRLDFWVELPNCWVTKCEYRFNDIYRVAESQWNDRGAFPDKVAIKSYSSNHLVSETTLKVLRMVELLELPPGIWTLAGLDLPVGTPVVKLNAGRQGYWNGKEVVPSLSESTQE